MFLKTVLIYLGSGYYSLVFTLRQMYLRYYNFPASTPNQLYKFICLEIPFENSKRYGMVTYGERTEGWKANSVLFWRSPEKVPCKTRFSLTVGQVYLTYTLDSYICYPAA